MTHSPDSSASDSSQERPGVRALERILAGEPPIPTRTRYQPLRMGMIGIWQYEEQEFVFYDGKLILRGHNGSGKTKALEVTSPLLLDAIINARRIDPFGNAARSMRDNLLYGGHNQQVGYVWTEYGRIAEDGSHQYLTIGIGMHALATHAKGLYASWFFTTPQRVGRDFSLWDDEERPRLRKGLEAVLGESCVHKRAKDYRAAVARQLFGFSPARLRALVDLLLTLRKPKLSEDFSAAKLMSMLSESLPPVSAALVDDLAGKFDELANNRDELETLVRNHSHVGTFLSAYGRLARRVVRHGGEQFLDASQQLRAAQTVHKQKKTQLEKALGGVAALQAEHVKLEQQRDALHARIAELRARPEMKQHGLITQLQKQVAETEKLTADARMRLEEAAAAEVDAEAELLSEGEDCQQALDRLVQLEGEASLRAATAALADAHQGENERIRREPLAARRALTGHIDSRSAILAKALELVQKVEQARNEHGTATRALERVAGTRDEAKAKCDAKHNLLKQRVDKLVQFLVEWAAGCEQLVLTDHDLGELLDAVPTLGEPGRPGLADLIAPHAQRAGRALMHTLASEQAALDALANQRDMAARQRDQVVAATDPVPGAPVAQRRERTEELGDGAALWKLLDFRPGLTSEEKARLEAAMLAAGVLDAWVTADGQVLAPDTLETVLVPTGGTRADRSLSDVLCPVEHPLVSIETTRTILASIALGNQGDASTHHTRVGVDGSWQIGLLHGRTTSTAAAYIGVAARESERLRRLAVLDSLIEELDGRIAGKETAISGLRARLEELDIEYGEARNQDLDLRQARQDLATAQELLQQRSQEVDEAQGRQQSCHKAVVEAENVLDDYARPRSVPTDMGSISLERNALEQYRSAVTDVCHEAKQWRQLCERASKAEQRLATCVRHRGTRGKELTEAEGLLARKKEALDVHQRLAGAGPQKVLAKLATAEQELEETGRALKDCVTASQEASSEVGALREAVASAVKGCGTCAEARSLALEDYRRLARNGFLALAHVDDAPASDAGLVEAQAQAAVRRLADEKWSEKDRNDARDEVDEEFRSLKTNLTGPDWRPRAGNDGPLLLVQIWHNGVVRSVTEAQDIMANEISTRRSMLDDHEHKLFTEVLLGNLGDHLRRRRAEAVNLVERMNALLQQVPTASGYLMKLKWEPAPRQTPEVKAALEALDGQASKHLPEAAREQLIRFLVGQVEDARAREATADWRVHLRQALDYRSWSRIRIRYKPGPLARWTDLTDDKHQLGSGGEKAVMLQLPLLVAAAAHYTGALPTAPRPVYLDEAFAGIDTPMRGRCLGLLTSLDLDVVMASHDEWGFHQEVPGVATYQLFRHPNIPGVLTTPIIWDGARRHDLPDPALRFGDGHEAGIDWGDDTDDYLDDEFDDEEENEGMDEYPEAGDRESGEEELEDEEDEDDDDED
ncbi:TIGR02680 family protein [Planotetraspora sp. A-T 1434]|uniref:TIGR02680 family protein n=1 Tax=Planotetraspora sp. A-T 1434 TaxID=2979219 RepID=UPI0021C1A8E6|nr:TIGR02680 family protein [Planotetraspora sp. A-T 1434]MCT9934528.1 TIGR02680 family protein [Planotetraspora sp. A-T 1434]